MGLKLQTNSLRCNRWFGFAKRAITKLREAELPGKAFVVEGYKILCKAAIQTAVVKAPAGIVYFVKALGEVRLFYADAFGYSKEKAVEIKPFRHKDFSVPFNPQVEAWPGVILPINLEADFLSILFCYTPTDPTDAPFDERYCIIANTLIPTSYVVLSDYALGFTTRNSYGEGMLRILTAVIDGKYCVYTGTSSTAFDFSNAQTIDVGVFELRPITRPGGYSFNILDDLAWFFPDSSSWVLATCVYSYVWKHFNATKNRYVSRIVFWIYAEASGFYPVNPYFLFTEFDPLEDSPNDFLLYGYTSGESLVALNPPYLPEYVGVPALPISSLTGYPESLNYNTNLIFPLANGELAVCYIYNPGGSLQFMCLVINEFDAPYVDSGLSIPCNPAVWTPEEENYSKPVCVRANDEDGVYLYWEEFTELGDVPNKIFPVTILRLKFGSPYASWIDFPTPPGKITGFTPVKIAWNHRIVLASIYVDDGIRTGTYAAVLDTERDDDWVLGARFSTERIDRCTPAIFGEHPYAKLCKEYSGTQWGWDYTYSENYPQ